LGKSTGSETRATIDGVDQMESQVEIHNASPGIRTLRMNVNGHRFRYNHLTSGQSLTISIASALEPGRSNTIVVVGIGPKGSSADLLLGPPTSQQD